MCSSSASLLYGITVNARDLIRGARAFIKFTRNATVLDLLLARKTRPTSGVLVSCSSRHCHLASTSSLSTLPAELLLLVRDHLREAYVEEEPSYWFNELHWSAFEDYDDYEQEEEEEDWDWSTYWNEDQWSAHTNYVDCDLCGDARYGDGEGIYHDGARKACSARTQGCICERSAITSIRQVLSHYDLALPSIEFFDLADVDMREITLAVTLPSASESASGDTVCATENMRTSNSHHDSPYEQPPLHTATFFDPSYFQTTEQDDRNFRRLVQDLELRIVETEGGTVRRWTKKRVDRTVAKREKEAAARGESGKDDGRGDARERRRGWLEVQPRWMLVQTSLSSV